MPIGPRIARGAVEIRACPRSRPSRQGLLVVREEHVLAVAGALWVSRTAGTGLRVPSARPQSCGFVAACGSGRKNRRYVLPADSCAQLFIGQPIAPMSPV